MSEVPLNDLGIAIQVPPPHTLVDTLAILCTGGPDVIRKEAWPPYRTSSGVRLCWELGEPTEPKGLRLER